MADDTRVRIKALTGTATTLDDKTYLVLDSEAGGTQKMPVSAFKQALMGYSTKIPSKNISGGLIIQSNQTSENNGNSAMNYFNSNTFLNLKNEGNGANNLGGKLAFTVFNKIGDGSGQAFNPGNASNAEGWFYMVGGDNTTDSEKGKQKQIGLYVDGPINCNNISLNPINGATLGFCADGRPQESIAQNKWVVSKLLEIRQKPSTWLRHSVHLKAHVSNGGRYDLNIYLWQYENGELSTNGNLAVGYETPFDINDNDNYKNELKFGIKINDDGYYEIWHGQKQLRSDNYYQWLFTLDYWNSSNPAVRNYNHIKTFSTSSINNDLTKVVDNWPPNDITPAETYYFNGSKL